MTRISPLLVALLLAPLAAGAQTESKWVGKRVFTKHGTVLRVGKTVVDDAGRTKSLRASGKDRQDAIVYRVEKTNGDWLWLRDGKSGTS